MHTTRCPERERREAAEKKQEEERQKIVTTLYIADSNARYINKKATNADVECVTGAKIGHLTNLLDQAENLKKYQTFVFSGGQNNIDPTPEINLDQWKGHQNKQLEELSSWVRGILKCGRYVSIQEIPAVPLTQDQKTSQMREYLNKSFEAILDKEEKKYHEDNPTENKSIKRATFVTGEMTGPDDEKYDDYRHVSKINWLRLLHNNRT